jgi:hypothetical protein
MESFKIFDKRVMLYRRWIAGSGTLQRRFPDSGTPPARQWHGCSALSELQVEQIEKYN